MAKGEQPPKSSAMKPAWELLEAGDVFLARRHAQQILKNPPTREDASEAEELLKRTGVPKQAFAFAALAAAVILVLILIAIFRVAR
jgi:hypothetical protein